MSTNEWNMGMEEQESPILGLRFSLQQGAWLLVREDGSEWVLSKDRALEYKKQGIPDTTPDSYYQSSLIPVILDIFY